MIAILVAISLIGTPANAQSAAAGAASSSSSSASSAAASNASITNADRLVHLGGAVVATGSPTAPCRNTWGFNALGLFGINGTSKDKECRFEHFQDRTATYMSMGAACLAGYDHYPAQQAIFKRLHPEMNIVDYCRSLDEPPAPQVIAAPPPPPMVMAAPPPPQVIEKRVVVTKVVYRTRHAPVHHKRKRCAPPPPACVNICTPPK